MPISTSSRADTGEISVPGEALRYILFQRTHYLALPRRPLLYRALGRLSGRSPLAAAVAIEAACRGGAVRRSFRRDMVREYEEIRPHLPERAESILDIGCGVGGIDVLLHRHYRSSPGLRFHLADRTQTSSRVYYGYEDRGAFYNSLDATRGLLVRNGVPAAGLRFHEVGDDGRLGVTEPVDLAISLISWGFHYPVSTYAAQVHSLLRPGGRAILDVRKGTDGLAELRARFARVAIVSESAKKLRAAATK